MKNLLKVFAVLFLFLAVAGFVSARGNNDQNSGSGDKKSLNFLYVGPGTAPGTYEYEMRKITDRYYQETGVTVNSEYYEFNDLLQLIEVKIGSGSNDYDVIGVDVPMVAAYVNRGYLAPVDPYFSAAEKAEFVPSALESGSWDGTFYCPPINTGSQCLYYNNDLLNQADIKIRPNDAVNRLTYEEVADMARQAVAKLDPRRTNGINGFQFHQVSRTYQMNMLPNSLGEKNIGPDGFTVDNVINSPGWVKAATWWQQLCNDGIALKGYTADETTDLFIAGKIVFFIAPTAWPARLQGKNIDWGFSPAPAFKGYEDKVGTPTGSWHVGITKNSVNKDLAANFVKYITLGSGSDAFVAGATLFPARRSALEQIEKDPSRDPVLKIAVYEVSHTAVPRARTPGYPEYSTVIDAMWEDIRNGANVKNSLDRAARDITSAMAKYR